MLVSIIMPAYNAGYYINDAINSVLSQTYSFWELIIVDDGSTDTTAKIVSEWLIRDKRIQYYYQQNGKQGKARNLGISKSQGKYLAFLDADDLWLPEKLEIQIREIKEKKADLVFSNSYIFYDDNINDTSKKMNVKKATFRGKNAVELFLGGNQIPVLTVLVKKQKVTDVGAFSEKLEIQNVEDYHLWLKLLLSDCIFYSSDLVLTKYRLHNNAATVNDKLALNKIPDAFFDLMQTHQDYKSQITKELKLKFKLFYKRNLFTKKELSIWINKNTTYLSANKIVYLYLLLNFFLPTKVTKRILIHILNA